MAEANRKSGRWTFVSTPLEACTTSLSPRPPEDTRAVHDLRLWLAYFDGTGRALWTGFSPDLPSGKLEPTEDLFEAIRDRGVKPITQDGFVSSLAKGLELPLLTFQGDLLSGRGRYPLSVTGSRCGWVVALEVEAV